MSDAHVMEFSWIPQSHKNSGTVERKIPAGEQKSCPEQVKKSYHNRRTKTKSQGL